MVWIVTANIGREKSAAFRHNAIRRVRQAFRPRPIIGWQEIDEKDSGNEHAFLRRQMKHYRWAGYSTRVPIGVPPAWRLVTKHTVRTSDGIYKVSPVRFITEAVVQHRVLRRRRFVILNNHTVAGAHTNPGQRAEAQRAIAWGTHFEQLQGRVQYWLERGLTVVVVGDFNHPRMPRIHPRERRVMHKGLDYVLVVKAAAGVRLGVRKRKTVRIGVDGHSAHGVHFSVKP